MSHTYSFVQLGFLSFSFYYTPCSKRDFQLFVFHLCFSDGALPIKKQNSTKKTNKGRSNYDFLKDFRKVSPVNRVSVFDLTKEILKKRVEVSHR